MTTRTITQEGEEFWEVSVNGNSFLYHQIRKMLGAAIATACGSWSFEYLKKCMGSLFVRLQPSSCPRFQFPWRRECLWSFGRFLSDSINTSI